MMQRLKVNVVNCIMQWMARNIVWFSRPILIVFAILHLKVITKMKNRRFTVIEMIVAGVIVLIGIKIVVFAVNGTDNGYSNFSMGVNGLTESRCIDGYKFIVSHDGNARQIMDELGKGIKCQ